MKTHATRFELEQQLGMETAEFKALTELHSELCLMARPQVMTKLKLVSGRVDRLAAVIDVTAYDIDVSLMDKASKARFRELLKRAANAKTEPREVTTPDQ